MTRPHSAAMTVLSAIVATALPIPAWAQSQTISDDALQISGNADAISDEDVGCYAKAYSTADRLRAGFEFYRTFDADADFFASRDAVFDVPLLILGAEVSMQAALPEVEASFGAIGVANIEAVAIQNAGH